MGLHCLESVRVAARLALGTSAHNASGWNPSGGRIQHITVWHVTTHQSLSLSSSLIWLNSCLAEWIKMPCPLLISSQSDYLIWVFGRNSHIKWQTVQIQISWLLQKPTDLDLHCLLRQGMTCSARDGLNNVDRYVKHQIMCSVKLLLRSV